MTSPAVFKSVVHVTTLPPCDMCGAKAQYDLPLRQGQWANLCRPCALLFTYLPMWELMDREPNLGSEFKLAEEQPL